jgi:hypothetical protein
LESAERFAEGLATEQELALAGRKGQQALGKARWSSDRHCSEHTYWQAAEAANHVTQRNYDGGDHPSVRHVAQSAATAWAFNLFYSRAEAKTTRPRINDDVLRRQAVHANYLRDIFGSLFRPVAIHAAWFAWNDGTVRRIARAIYEERAFNRMPILADALEDSGCDNADILAHCRSEAQHFKGCWVVDSLLRMK